MNDQQFRERYHPLTVPAHFDAGAPLNEQTLYALAQLVEATADEVVFKMKELHGGENDKQLIAKVHELLTGWHEQGRIAGKESPDGIRYNLHKVTEANDGQVNPNLLAPGLD